MRMLAADAHSYCRQAAGSLRSPADKGRRRTLPRASRTEFCAAAGREPVGATGLDNGRVYSLKVVGGHAYSQERRPFFRFRLKTGNIGREFCFCSPPTSTDQGLPVWTASL